MCLDCLNERLDSAYLTHELDHSFPRHWLPVVRRDLATPAEVDDLDLEAPPTHHDDAVGLQVQMHDAAVVEELTSVEHLATTGAITTV